MITREKKWFSSAYASIKYVMPTIQQIREKLTSREEIIKLFHEKKESISFGARISLLNNLMLRENAIRYDQMSLDKDQLAIDFFNITGCSLADVNKIEYRRERKNEYPIQVDWEKQYIVPDFIRFSDERTWIIVAREWQDARVLRQIIHIVVPDIIVEERY